MAPNITIVQHNVLAWTYARRNELNNIYQTIDPDVILINAHGMKEEQRMKLFQYNIYQKNTMNEHHSGVAIAIKRTIKHTVIDDLEEDFLAVKISTTLGELIIATGYLPPRHPHVPNQTMLRLFRNQLPVIFAGDLNARHAILDHGNNNPAGEFINQLIRRGNTIHLGPHFKTYITPRASGSPDIVLANNKLTHNVHISPGPLTTSDHIPVIIKISMAPIQVPVNPRFNYNKANWERFTEQLSSFTLQELEHQPVGTIDSQLNKWLNAIKRAMKDNIPITAHRTLPHGKITHEIRVLQTAFKNIQSQAAATGWTPNLRNITKILQTNLTAISSQNKDLMWAELLAKTEHSHKDPTKFWKNIKTLLGSETEHITYLLDPHGVRLTTAEQQANEFSRHLRNTFQIPREDNQNFCQETQLMVENYLRNSMAHKPHTIIDYTRLDENNFLTKPITRNEIMTQIRSFKNRKAPGITKIDKTVLLKLPINMLDSLKVIYNAALSSGYFPTQFKVALIKMILKQGKQSIHPVNYRPISLLETVGKTYEKILNTRLKLFLNRNNHNNPHQHAYQTGRGTISAIAITYEQVAMSQQEHHQCNLINRDISKAFDKVWHDGLKYKICQLHMPRIMTSTLCNFLDNRIAIVQVNTSLSRPFPLEAGVPQGAVLSPTLFNIYTADIGEIPGSTYTAYADDVTQIVTHHGSSKEIFRRKTTRAIEALNQFERRWKIKTNRTKFQLLHISKRTPLPITIDQTPIPYTASTKLLGLHIKYTGITPHIRQQRHRASTTLRKLRRFRCLSSKLKLYLYKALVLPLMDYPPIPLNTIKPTNWRKLQSIQNRALRWVNGDLPPYETTVEELHNKYKLEPLNIRNFRLAYNAWDRIRMEFPHETDLFEMADFATLHSWWPLSYISVDTRPPQPIFKYNTERQQFQRRGYEAAADDDNPDEP